VLDREGFGLCFELAEAFPATYAKGNIKIREREAMEKRKIKVVIIGGVATGPKTAARLRRLNPEAEITIIERGKILSYAGCGLPYYVSGDVAEYRSLNSTPAGIPRDSVFFRNVKNIKVLDRTLARSIDRIKKTVDIVHVETGESDTLSYDELVLATGGQPVNLPIEGTDLNNVFRLWQPEDALAMSEVIASKGAKTGVIIGGGLIGVEMTEALTKRGVDVTVVEMMDHILPGLLDEEVAAYLARYVRSQGVDILTGIRVKQIVGNDHGDVVKVITSEGEIPSDLVLIAVGVRSNSKLAQEVGLKIGKTGGIVVNEYLQTSDPDIFAGGDCVENIHLMTGENVYVPLGSTANKHGRVIANNIMGYQEKFDGILGTAVVKVFNYNVAKTGLTERHAREAGFDVVTALSAAPDSAHYYPTHKPLLLKLIADRKTKKILGLQAAGLGETVKRLDVVSTAMTFGATVDDLPALDLGYAPPYSTAVDIAAHVANILRNKIDGIAKALTPMEVKAKVEKGEDFIWLDVRSPEEQREKRIEDPRVKLIPLGMLRQRLHDLPRDKEIITFCKISLRGYEAQTILDGEGYKDVKFMDGGIDAWPYDVVFGGLPSNPSS
jgi:NADPH-dependent 2,4-dienoyl-CoA reductase/sulfur reductase-like enzyme/rhodanese-related sulfurtransferase